MLYHEYHVSTKCKTYIGLYVICEISFYTIHGIESLRQHYYVKVRKYTYSSKNPVTLMSKNIPQHSKSKNNIVAKSAQHFTQVLLWNAHLILFCIIDTNVPHK